MNEWLVILLIAVPGGILLERATRPDPLSLIASWYGEELRGKLMANGKPFNPGDFTCASWDYPFGTRLRVTHKGRFVIVQVTDRGPAKRLNRAIDLSHAAFRALADPKLGLIEVRISTL